MSAERGTAPFLKVALVVYLVIFFGYLLGPLLIMGITAFNSEFRAMYHLMSAGSLVAALPPVAMFFLMQKHFIAGLTLGAVK